MTLYETLVPPFRKTLGNLTGLLEKAEAHCARHGLAAEELIQARLAPDMQPLAYQVKSAAVHSIGAIEGVRRGSFSPDTTPPPETFATLGERLAQASAALATLDPAEVDGFEGQPMAFRVGDHVADFTAEQFLLTFSVPNFYFHVTTAYAILRMKGLEIGKIDYLGALPFRR